MKKRDTGIIFDIQRYSLHDGPGIRTLVFMKGCPLRCLWCSNPESQNFEIETGFNSDKCILCGKCLSVCPKNAIKADTYDIERNLCTASGNCVDACPFGAKKTIGEEVDVDSIIEIVEKDSLFYRNSNGGITVGGGEPCYQSGFVAELLKGCKVRHINTCVETCGYASEEDFVECVEYADLIMYDIKHMDTEKHFALTGVKNEKIISNLKSLRGDKKIIVRIPLIPTMNDDLENISKTIAFAESIEGVIGVELLPYHTLGSKKYAWVGKEYSLKELNALSEEEKEKIKSFISNRNNKIEVNLI